MFKYHIDELSFVSITKGLLCMEYSGIYLLSNTYAYKYGDSSIDFILF